MDSEAVAEDFVERGSVRRHCSTSREPSRRLSIPPMPTRIGRSRSGRTMLRLESRTHRAAMARAGREDRLVGLFSGVASGSRPRKRWSNSRCSRAALRPSRPNSCSASGRTRPPTRSIGPSRKPRSSFLAYTSGSRPRAVRSRRSTSSAHRGGFRLRQQHRLLLGPAIPHWRKRPLESLTCQTFIDDRLVGAAVPPRSRADRWPRSLSP